MSVGREINKMLDKTGAGLMEGMDWDKKLSGVSDKAMARLVVPAGGSIRIHLGHGLHLGNDGRSVTSIYLRKGLHYRRRKHALELKGPLTAGDLLRAMGEGQLYECVRNQVLASWLGRHLGEDFEDDSDVKTPVDLLPLKPEWAELYEGRTITIRPGDQPIAIPPSATETRLLEAPADLDPTAGKSLEELMDLMGGKERAIDYIVGGGSTFFVGLEAVRPTGGEGADGIEEYKMLWSEPFA